MEVEKVVDPKFDSEDKLDLDQQDPSSKGEDLIHLSSMRKLRWLTHTLKEAKQVGARRSTFWVSHPPRVCPYVVMMSSIIDPQPSINA